jgi:hypothetical protein
LGAPISSYVLVPVLVLDLVLVPVFVYDSHSARTSTSTSTSSSGSSRNSTAPDRVDNQTYQGKTNGVHLGVSKLC